MFRYNDELMRGLAAITLLVACGRGNFELDADVDGGPPKVRRVQAVVPGSAGPVAGADSLIIDQTAGDLLVIGGYGSTPIYTVADTAGETYTPLAPEQTGGGCIPTSVRLWYTLATQTTQNTITVAQFDNGIVGAVAIEYAGIAPSLPLDDNTGTIATVEGNQLSAGTVSTTTTDVVVALFADHNFIVPIDVAFGWRSLGNDDPFAMVIEDQVLPAGSITPTANLSASNVDACWAGTSAAFKSL